MHTYIHVYMYTYIHIYIYTYIHIYMYTCIHVYMYTYPRKADKGDTWCTSVPQGHANGSLLVVFCTKRETYFLGWVIWGRGKLQCVPFITLKRIHTGGWWKTWYVYMYVYISAYMCTCIMHVQSYRIPPVACMYICIYVCMYINAYIIYVYMYLCLHICIYVCVYICIYV